MSSSVAAALWGCTGLSVGVHRYNDNTGIEAAFWQMAGPPVPNPQFNIAKYLISENDARFVIVVNIESNFLPINNVLIGDILSVDLFLDGFHVSEFLWDTGILKRDRPARVAILASPVNPATSEVKTFKFTEPILSLDDNNNKPNPFLGTIEVVVSHARGHVNTQGLPMMVDHTRPFPNNSTIPLPQTTPHVITYHRRTHHVAAPAGMTKTATIGQPCRFHFKYGTRGFIEHLMGGRLVMPGDRDHPGTSPAPASRRPPPSQAVRDKTHQDVVAAHPRQNVPADSALVNASNQIMDIMRNVARDHAVNVVYKALRRGDMISVDTPRGPPVAGPSNVFHTQNRPASMAQPHHGGMGTGMGYQQGPPPVTGQPPGTPRGPPVAGPSNVSRNQRQNTPMGQPPLGGMGMGMGYQQGPPPVTRQPPGTPRGPPAAGPSNVSRDQNQPAPVAQPHHSQMGYHQGPPPATTQHPNTGGARAQEIDELRQFSDGVRFVRRPVTGYAGLPLTSARSNITPAFTAINAGLPLSPASPNTTSGFTAINAGSTVSSIGAGPDAGVAASASRRRAAQPGDSVTSARDRGGPAGRAATADPPEDASRRRRATPLSASNLLAGSVSVSIGGDDVPANRRVTRTRAAHAQQAPAATSTTGRPLLADGLHRSQENIVAMTSGNDTNSARPTVTSPDSAHIAASAGNVPVTAPASATLASGSDDSDVPLAQTSARRGANRSAVAEGVTRGASAGEGADSSSADVPVAAQGTSSASNLATLAPDGSTGNATVPVNKTTVSGSEGDYSPPHKRQKANRGDSGGTTGDKDV